MQIARAIAKCNGALVGGVEPRCEGRPVRLSSLACFARLMRIVAAGERARSGLPVGTGIAVFDTPGVCLHRRRWGQTDDDRKN